MIDAVALSAYVDVCGADAVQRNASMTLNDLLLLMKHYLRWVIAVPIACALCAGAFAFAGNVAKDPDYSASATLTIADPSNSLSTNNLSYLLNATAQRIAADLSDGEVRVSAKPDEKSQSVSISASAPSAEKAKEIANIASDQTTSAVSEILLGQAEAFRQEQQSGNFEPSSSGEDVIGAKAVALESCVFSVVPASAASEVDSRSSLKFVLAGFAGGLFLVAMILIAYDLVKRPIKSKDDINAITDLPVLNGRGGASGVEITCANLLNYCEGAPSLVCVVPEKGSCEEFGKMLQTAFDRTVDGRVEVEALASPGVSANAYLEARNADAVVVCVERWKGDAVGLGDCLEELSLAKAKVVGVVLV